MSEPKRIVDDESAGAEQALLRNALENDGGEYAPTEAKWRALEDRAQGGTVLFAVGVKWAAVAVCAATVIVSVVWWQWPSSSAPDLGAAVAAVNGAPFKAERRGELIVLHEGKLEGRPVETLTQLLTPHMTVAWKAARFLAFVTPDRTVLSVDEGYVVARQRGTERLVSKGEELIATADALSAGGSELIPGGLKQMPQVQGERCQQANAVEAARCLAEVAAGSDLAAQNALFELALRSRGQSSDEAIARWREYLHRFPNGVLAPEAQVGIAVELTRSGRLSDALQETQRYLSKWGDEPSAREVVELRTRLETWAGPKGAP